MTTAPSPTPPRHLLFLCTGNSARSILAEAICRLLPAESPGRPAIDEMSR